MELFLQNNIFRNSSGEELSLNDMLDENFYKFSDTIADEYKVDLCICNDMYFAFIQKIMALKFYSSKNSVDHIKINVLSTGFDLICITLAAAECLGIKVKMNGFAFALKNILDKLKSMVCYLGSVVYIFFKAVCRNFIQAPDNSYDYFSIVRIKQEYDKYGFLRKDKRILFDYENIKSTLSKSSEIEEYGNVYNRFRFSEKIKWLFNASCNYFRVSDAKNAFLKTKVSSYAAKSARSYYSKRIVHAMFYREMLDSYFSLFRNKTFITGKNWDRYAMIENETAKKYGIKVIVFSHGVGYGFKLPDGYIGDEFYALSAYSASFFNRLYETDKFIFNENVVRYMLCKGYDKKSDAAEVVFFSEAHEPEVNIEIISKLTEVFDCYGIALVLKPHPLENPDFYSGVADKITVEKSFEKAITGNICIARRSTTLLEAIYNGSEAYAILTNISDNSLFKMYPALHDERINLYYDIAELAENIAKQLNK